MVNKIKIVRGTTNVFNITVNDESGAVYELAAGEKIVFGVKCDTDDDAFTLLKTASFVEDEGVYAVTLTPADTEGLTCGDYVYDVVTVEAAPLEEVTVYPAYEKQTITPSEGYYGIGSIVVEPMPEDPGTDGPGNIEDIPSAEDITFGGEYVTTEVQTGVVSMVDKDGESFTLPKLPDVCFEDGAHWVIRKIKVSDEERKFTLICCTDEYRASDDSIAFWPSVGNKASCIFEFECSMYLGTMSETHENSTEWLPTDSFNGSSSLQAATVYLSNIIGDDGNIIGKCNEVIYETEKVISFQPAEREALYTISGDTLNAIGMAVQAITNGAMMTPSAMAVALQTLAQNNEVIICF